jgi:transposase
MSEAPRVKIREPRRDGQRIVFILTENTLPPEHPARLFWEIFGGADLRPFTAGSSSFVARPGRSEISPRLKLSLWAYAISLGISSAREIERRTRSDFAFGWLVGDLHVGHATLSDFLTHHLAAFRALFVECLAQLAQQGLVDLSLVAQDGTRVLAWASHASFRKELALDACREQAELHLQAVLAGDDDPEPTPRRRAARLWHAKNFKARVFRAKAVIAALRLRKQRSKDRRRRAQVPRASTTDPDARLMKLANGSIAPAYNIQLAVAGKPLGGPVTIVGVRASQLGTDQGSLVPMCREIERCLGRLPGTLLADANHATHEELRALHGKVTLLIPVPEKSGGQNGAKDEAIEAWRQRMGTAEAQQLYRSRKALCERPNSTLKVRFGLRQVKVRGVTEVLSLFLVAAIVHNIVEHRDAWLETVKRRLAA